MEISADDEKRIRGFMFLSQKPILYVVNVNESHTSERPGKSGCEVWAEEIASRRNAGATAICGKVEAELAAMSDEDAPDFLGSYGLNESGLTRLIRKTYELLEVISFFTIGEDECRAWTEPRTSRAQTAAGAIRIQI